MRMDQHNNILKAQLQRKMLKIIRFRYLQTHGTSIYTGAAIPQYKQGPTRFALFDDMIAS